MVYGSPLFLWALVLFGGALTPLVRAQETQVPTRPPISCNMNYAYYINYDSKVAALATGGLGAPDIYTYMPIAYVTDDKGKQHPSTQPSQATGHWTTNPQFLGDNGADGWTLTLYDTGTDYEGDLPVFWGRQRVSVAPPGLSNAYSGYVTDDTDGTLAYIPLASGVCHVTFDYSLTSGMVGIASDGGHEVAPHSAYCFPGTTVFNGSSGGGGYAYDVSFWGWTDGSSPSQLGLNPGTAPLSVRPVTPTTQPTTQPGVDQSSFLSTLKTVIIRDQSDHLVKDHKLKALGLWGGLKDAFSNPSVDPVQDICDAFTVTELSNYTILGKSHGFGVDYKFDLDALVKVSVTQFVGFLKAPGSGYKSMFRQFALVFEVLYFGVAIIRRILDGLLMSSTYISSAAGAAEEVI